MPREWLPRTMALCNMVCVVAKRWPGDTDFNERVDQLNKAIFRLYPDATESDEVARAALTILRWWDARGPECDA